jgi:hypothetical protein
MVGVRQLAAALFGGIDKQGERKLRSSGSLPGEKYGLRVCHVITGSLCCWPASRSPKGRSGGRASAALPLLDDDTDRLRRGALHLPARRLRQSGPVIT